MNQLIEFPLLRSGTGVSVGAASGVKTPGPLPLNVPMILCIGRNYPEHAKEMTRAEGTGAASGAAKPGAAEPGPTVFAKNLASLCLHGDEIIVPKVCQDATRGGPLQVDYEGELAVVIGFGREGEGGAEGRRCRDVSRAEALGFVLGYTCANDVSARWWQKQGSGGQFVRGKSFDTFCPIGPGLWSAASVGDPGSLRLVTRVNGEVRQESSTGAMMYDVATLVSELSKGMTLLPGTVILTGTPAGVGAARTPAQFLKDGDVVEVELSRGSGETLGVLRNRVRFE
jgi:2-keto-4-pentenoate hydratase/2-oxohepta-3-ene-1,7-dioic acid hydratase in catechol pathway